MNKLCKACDTIKELTEFRNGRNVCSACGNRGKLVIRLKDISIVRDNKLFNIKNQSEEFVFELNNTRYWPNDFIGIYGLFSKSTGKKYVGYTMEKAGFKGRWLRHYEMLIKNNHDNQYLQHSYDKHGINDFYFKILQICNRSITKDEIMSIEHIWIDKLESMYFQNGWNIDTYDEYNKRKTFHRASRTERQRTFELIDPQGNIIKYTGIKKFADENNMSDSCIVNLLNGKIKSYKGYKSINKEFHKKEIKHTLISPEGKIIEFNCSIKKFCEQNNLGRSGIQNIINGKFQQFLGWTNPKFPKKEVIIYELISPNGENIKFNCVKEFCIENKLIKSSIYSLLRGTLKSSGGWHNPKFPILEEKREFPKFISAKHRKNTIYFNAHILYNGVYKYKSSKDIEKCISWCENSLKELNMLNKLEEFRKSVITWRNSKVYLP